MDVGLMLTLRTLPQRPEPLEKVYRDYMDDVVLGEQLGFDFAWTSEHHFAPDAWSPSQLPILAHIAGRTSTIRLGTNVFIMPFHDPVRVAEDVATVDLLSDGRLDFFAMGAGSIRDEFDTFGIDPHQRWGRLFEGAGIVRRCFAEDQFDHEGRYFRFPDIRMTTKPVQDPFPLYIGGFGPKLLRRAGREGFHVQTSPGPFYNWYAEGLAEAGHDPANFNFSAFNFVHIAPTHDQAWDEADEGTYHGRTFYRKRDWIAHSELPPIPPMEEQRKEPLGQQFVGYIGTVDEVLPALEQLLKDTAITRFGFTFRHAGMSTAVVRRSMETFASEILPEVRNWGREPVRAPRRCAASPSAPVAS